MQVQLKQTRSELAIFGGSPSFDAALHVGRPVVADRGAFLRRVEGVLDRNWLTNDGPLLREFEDRLATFCGVEHCIAMANGSLALTAVMQSLRITGEVIMPSYTFVATAHATTLAGATPIFADIDPRTHHLNPDAVERLIGPRTSAIVPVHLWGGLADTEAFSKLGKKYNVPIIYDAAHAFGSSSRLGIAGTFGSAEVFSFHSTKFLGAIEGGAVATNDSELAATLRDYRNFGFRGLDDVAGLGTNAKMNEISAAMGLTNLEQVQDIMSRNRENLDSYVAHMRSELGDAVCMMQYPEQNSNCQYAVVTLSKSISQRRDFIIRALHAENVLARKYFWPGCHNFPPYRDRKWSLPQTDTIARASVVLPTGPGLSEQEIRQIVRIFSLAAQSLPESIIK